MYSKVEDGIFCLPCVLFATSNDLGQFVTEKFLIINVIVFMTNAFNFRMEQLLDSPTTDLILFITVDTNRTIGLASVVLIFCMIIFFLIISMCVVHHGIKWFFIETGHHRANPYKLVCRVIQFAWKHKVLFNFL